MLLISAISSAQLDIFKFFKGELSEEKIIAGLKEALNIGTENSVKSTGCKDGYFGNETIKIVFPEKLQNVEGTLRKIGLNSAMDEFILSMNRAAESAAPHAKQIFLDAIMEMSFDDARKILKGNDTAATEYFRDKTSNKLSKEFQPVVNKATDEFGVTKKYKELEKQVKAIPFIKIETIDIDQYVVDKALDGLFHVLGEEEKKIRTDPAARVTDLLKEVFGS
jgi:hypothetical protein